MIRLALRLAWREILNNRRFSAFFLFNLILGLTGFLALNSFKLSLESSLQARSRLLLTADMAVTSRRPLSPEEETVLAHGLPRGTAENRLIQMYSMVSGPEGTARLAELVAIPEGHPFYGEIGLASGRKRIGRSSQAAINNHETWLAPELSAQLKAVPGSRVKLGEQVFTVDDIVLNDVGISAQGFSLAPRLYIAMSALGATGLMQKGSTASYRRLYRLPPDVDAEELVHMLDRQLKEPGIRVITHRQASESVGRMQGFLNDYLGLASLAALFLAAVGAAYLFRSFLARRRRSIAILLSLGAPRYLAEGVYVCQLVFLGMIASLTAYGLTQILVPVTFHVLGEFLPFALTPLRDARGLIFAVALGTGGSVLICLPFLASLRSIRPVLLFGDMESTSPWNVSTVLSALPGLLVYWVLAVSQARSWRTGSIFVGVFLGAGCLLAVFGWFALRFAGRLQGIGFRSRLALRSLSRNRWSSISIFLSLGLGTLLINLIPQIQRSLETEVAVPEVSHVPDLFLFDIQDEQKLPLKAFVENAGFRLDTLTPLIRGRLKSVNGKAWEKEENGANFATREEERAERLRNRGFNLTYRAGLTESERIVRGRAASAAWPGGNQIPEITLEARFAERTGLRLDDRLEFDVQGLPVSGKVVGFRRVKWTSFQPNFFVQFQPGVLEDAPKTWLASISHLRSAQKAQLQNHLVKDFPNVSIIDVSTVIQKVLAIFSQMAWAIRVMAVLAVFAGLIALFSIAHHQAMQRQREAQLLKILGSPSRDIVAIYLLEFGGLALVAGSMGTVLSFGVSWVVSRIIFERLWSAQWEGPVLLVLIVTAMAAVTVYGAIAQTLQQKPADLLQAD